MLKTGRIRGQFFLMGSEDGLLDEQPVHQVWIDAFEIGATQVTNSEYASFASATGHALLLAGLQGRSFADLNGDRRVTLGEIARSVHDDMRFAEDQTSASIFTGGFNTNTLIAVAHARSDAAIGRRVEVKSDGDWYKARIIDAKNRQYRVHYFGYEVADDEWVGPDALRRTGQRPGAGRAR